MSSAQAPTREQRIEYLVLRRFPNVGVLKAALAAGPGHRPDTTQLRANVDAYRRELQALTPQKLSALHVAEWNKETEQQRLKAEADERALHFNQPIANADYDHWSRAAHWTLDEAIALSFGKAPERVNWGNVNGFVHISPFAFQYSRRRDLALRALRWEQLFDPVLPGIFLAWAKRTDIPVPAELTAAVEARGVQVVDWKRLYEESQATWQEHYSKMEALFERSRAESNSNHDKWRELSGRKDELIASLRERLGELERQAAAVPAEKSLGAKEQESLLKLVIGMAVIGYARREVRAMTGSGSV